MYCSYHKTNIVLICLGMTAVICTAITIFAIQTKVCALHPLHRRIPHHWSHPTPLFYPTPLIPLLTPTPLVALHLADRTSPHSLHPTLLVTPVITGRTPPYELILDNTCIVSRRYTNTSLVKQFFKATSWSTIPYAHISATIQQIITKFSAGVTYVK